MNLRERDPRIRLLWWAVVTTIAIMASEWWLLIVLLLLVCLSWIGAKSGKRLVGTALKILPFLAFMMLISLFPTFDIMRAVVSGIRYSVMVLSILLILTITPYGEITLALRHLKTGRVKRLDAFLEVSAFVFGLAFMTVPLAAAEWEKVKEVMRSRGVELTEGGKIQQMRRAITMSPVLILRIIDRMKNVAIAVIMYGYNPFYPRSIYMPLILSPIDKRFALVTSAIGAIMVIIAFVKV